MFLAGIPEGQNLRGQAVPQVAHGTIVRLDSMGGPDLLPRPVDVWLPPDYALDSQRRYPVLYMHDGQNLYDPQLAFGGNAWNIDDTLSTGQLPACIVVGIWNSPQRRREYGPQSCYAALPKDIRDSIHRQFGGAPISDAYLSFLVQQLKPLIDQKFRTFPDREHTMVAGSSFGGLISMYAICEYPQVFGAAACLSTHWPGSIGFVRQEIPAMFLHYLRKKGASLRRANSHIYFDCGNQTLDSLYPAWQQRAHRILSRKLHSDQWQSLYFEGDAHNEYYWSRRLRQPLTFMLRTAIAGE
jgi:predicted alpha/beta superfamily hydrolase